MPAAAQQAPATDLTLVGPDACPIAWSPPGPTARGGTDFDGNVTVLVGGNLRVAAAADGAEGIVVVRGTATFDRGARDPYEVGVTAIGSGVTPHPDSDMLVVGGDVNGSPGAAVDVGRGLDGDVAVGGAVAEGTQVVVGGGRLDVGVRQVLDPYDAALAGLGAKSAGYAARPTTGTVEVSESAITLTGDGTSDPQVFSVDGALAAVKDDDHDDHGRGEDGPRARSLQVLGVPDGAAVVVNLTGPAVDLDLDTLLSPAGDVVDPSGDRYFANLSTHLLWNAPGAQTVDVGGQAQLPGSLLVPAGSSTTTLAGPGTNGRILVGGDLVHAGTGQLHSYPFLRDPDLTCGPDLKHVGVVTLDVTLKDPRDAVDKDRTFQGEFACRLDGVDVTPGAGTWVARPGAATQVLSGQVPVGAICELSERLAVPPAPGWDWDAPEIAPEKLVVAKRNPRGFSVTNSVTPTPPPPPPPPDPTPTPTPTPEVPEPSPTVPVEEPTVEPTATPEPSGTPDEAIPSQPPISLPDDVDGDVPDAVPNAAEPPGRPGNPGPLTTTAPFTLRGAFVWGPLLLLSVLALRLRAPWQRKRRPLGY